MSISSCIELQHAILRLLRDHPRRRMASHEVYEALELQFPQLTTREKTVRYQHSVSKFANSVQWAVHRLRESEHLLPVDLSGHGFWELSDIAGVTWPGAMPSADDLAREMLKRAQADAPRRAA